MAHDIDTIALEAAERIMQISFQPMLGGAPQLKAKIQCEVRTALAALANPSMIIVRPQAPVEHVSIKSVIGAPSSQTDASSDDLLDHLQRAIDGAVTQPGKWVEGLAAGGEIATPLFDHLMPATIGKMRTRRDAWLAIAAVNALPELMERVRSAEKDTLETMQALHRLEAKQEILRMQLAACGVVALANTPDSAAKARDMHTDYMSASCQDVMRAVDREMELRAELERLRATLPATTTCCGDPGDCAQPCEAERKPSAKTARALEQAREIRERLAGDELPNGLSWDQAPEWATVLVRHLDGQHAWAAAYANGAKATKADRRATVNGLGAIHKAWTLIATRPTQKAPCTDCGACVGGPHGCGKPGLHGKAEPADDGWIEWSGGECPVDEGTLVDVWHFDGEVFYGANAFAFGPAYDWSHETPHKNGDIIAYRLHRPATPRRDATQN